MGLNIGADDYIMKPYTIRNVIARVKSVLRRTSGNKAATAQPQKKSDSASRRISAWSRI